MLLTCDRQLLVVCILTMLGHSASAWAKSPEPVHICYHDGEWPPYIYFQRQNKTVNTSVVEGATVTLFNKIFRRLKLDHSITMMPWKRCLHEVTTFNQQQKYEMTFNASFNEDRASKFYITSPLYRTRQALFYSTKKFTTPPTITSGADLKGYRLCGILGYNYTMYRKAGVINSIDTSARGLSNVLEQIANNRCDFFPSPMEPISAGKKLEVYNYSDHISAIEIPWAGTTTFHAFIAKSSPRALELYTQINQELQILQGSGESDEIFKQWLENGDGL